MKSSRALNNVSSLSAASYALPPPASMLRRSLALKGSRPPLNTSIKGGLEAPEAPPVKDVKFSRLALMAIPANLKALGLSSHYFDEIEIWKCHYSPNLMSSKLAKCLSLRRQTERRNPQRNRKSTLWVGKVLLHNSARCCVCPDNFYPPPAGRLLAGNVRFCGDGKCVR